MTQPQAAREPAEQPSVGAPPAQQKRRFHGTVRLAPVRVGSNAGRPAEEVIAHLAGLVGADISVTLEIEANIPQGAPDQGVRTVTENCRTLKFTNYGPCAPAGSTPASGTN